jgi:hypothetical protein
MMIAMCVERYRDCPARRSCSGKAVRAVRRALLLAAGPHQLPVRAMLRSALHHAKRT